MSRPDMRRNGLDLIMGRGGDQAPPPMRRLLAVLAAGLGLTAAGLGWTSGGNETVPVLVFAAGALGGLAVFGALDLVWRRQAAARDVAAAQAERVERAAEKDRLIAEAKASGAFDRFNKGGA